MSARVCGCVCVHSCVHVHACVCECESHVCIFNSCNMDMSALPDMYTQIPRAVGPRDEGGHIRQNTNAHVTIIL